MMKRATILIITSVFSLQVSAQYFSCIKGDSTKNRPSTAFAQMSPLNKSHLPEQFGYMKLNGKPHFIFRWVKKPEVNLDLNANKGIAIEAITVTLDNDSVAVFHPGYFSGIDKNTLYIEADINPAQLREFKDHKMQKLTLVENQHVRYDLFIFTEQNKIDIQRVTECFLTL